MDFLDWLTVLFSFAIALYLVFLNGCSARRPPNAPTRSSNAPNEMWLLSLEITTT